MKRAIVFLIGVLASSSLPLMAGEQAAANEVHKATVTVATPLTVGTQTIKAGEYKFECRLVDGQHVMAFLDSKGNEVAKAPCVQQPLDQKITTTEYRARNNPDGSKSLTAVRIKGETIAHTVAQS